MKLSTKGRYASRLMLELALNYGNGSILLKDIAKRQELSMRYLEQLIPPLKAAGLITSIRGSHGGYMLARPPSRITLKEVIQTMEGSLYPVKCIDSPAVCHRVTHCITRDIWRELGEKITKTLESITLQDMAERQKDKTEINLVYNI